MVRYCLLIGIIILVNSIVFGSHIISSIERKAINPNLIVPVNDDCAGAVTLIPQVYQGSGCLNGVAGTTEGATQSNTNCTTGNDDDVWYSFTAGSISEIIRFCNITSASGTFPSTMAMDLYSPCGVYLSICVPSMTISGGSGTGTTFGTFSNLAVNTIYYLRIWTKQTTGRVNFNITVYNQAVTPVNNECAGALNIVPQEYQGGCVNSTYGTTEAATQSNANCNSGYDDDIWYSFIPNSSFATVRLCNITLSSGTFPSKMSLDTYTICSSSYDNCKLIPIDGNSGNGTVTANLSGLIPNTTNFLRIYTEGITGRVSFDINIFKPPINDNCNGALSFSPSINGNCNYVNLSTGGASQTSSPIPECTLSGNDDDIWYYFTASASGIHRLTYNGLTAITGTALNLGYDIYSGGCGSLVPLINACKFNVGSGGQGSSFTPSLTAGTTYRLRLWVGGFPNSGSFNLCLEDQSPLPVELSKFNATAYKYENELSWQTESEVNALSFNVEKALDESLNDFESIGTIQASGNFNTVTNYSFIDKNPFPLSFYKLKIIDTDGSYEYSKIISVENNTVKSDNVRVFPVPAREEVYIHFFSSYNGGQALNISDMNGRIIESKTLIVVKGENHFQLNLINYNPGIYILNLKSSGSNFNVKIIKH